MMRKGWMKIAAASFVVAACVAAATLNVRAGGLKADGLLQPGTVAPAFTLPSQTDAKVSLADYKGKFVVLYFYPKDMTSGCTVEAHNFERDKAKYAAIGAVVLGVSLDTVESHKTFCTKDGLNFKLLADPEGRVIAEYGVPVSTHMDVKYAQRDTFLISPDGKVLQVWQVKDVQAHSDEVLAAIATFKK